MRSFTALACTIAVTACSGTDGDILRTRSDGSVTQRPRPAPLGTWQIQLSGALDTTVDARSYIVDVATPPSVIGGLHDAGRIVLCYFSAGTMEPFRDDASRFPASTLGAPLVDYPDERWVDIRDATVRAIMQDRIIAAAGAGCDGVHPSGVAAFQESTNLDFTRADQVALRSLAHHRGPRPRPFDRAGPGRRGAQPGSRRRLRLGRAVDLPRHRLRPRCRRSPARASRCF